ncbi:MAG: hypothetical protein AAB403_06675, partial [Planctomycetota bacterium]
RTAKLTLTLVIRGSSVLAVAYGPGHAARHGRGLHGEVLPRGSDGEGRSREVGATDRKARGNVLFKLLPRRAV